MRVRDDGDEEWSPGIIKRIEDGVRYVQAEGYTEAYDWDELEELRDGNSSIEL